MAHGGRLWADNNPERGATFSVALPGNVSITTVLPFPNAPSSGSLPVKVGTVTVAVPPGFM